jgi:hypothetical protein
MARPTKKINTAVLQNIVDGIPAGKFDNAMALCSFAAAKYNQQMVGMDYEQIDHQLVKLRITADPPVIKLNFPLPIGKRGRAAGSKLSPEHKEKMIAGRQKKNIPAGNLINEWRQNMTEKFAGKQTLLNGVIDGRAKACVKAFCIECMGGYKNRSPEDPPLSLAIRDCRGVSCPLYPIRPFQKKESE